MHTEIVSYKGVLNANKFILVIVNKFYVKAKTNNQSSSILARQTHQDKFHQCHVESSPNDQASQPLLKKPLLSSNYRPTVYLNVLLFLRYWKKQFANNFYRS